MSYNFFRMLRSVSLTRITSDRLRAVGQSLMLFIAWAMVVTLTLVWVSLLIEGVGYISTSLTAWL
jgi:hypothetical protein